MRSKMKSRARSRNSRAISKMKSNKRVIKRGGALKAITSLFNSKKKRLPPKPKSNNIEEWELVSNIVPNSSTSVNGFIVVRNKLDTQTIRRTNTSSNLQKEKEKENKKIAQKIYTEQKKKEQAVVAIKKERKMIYEPKIKIHFIIIIK